MLRRGAVRRASRAARRAAERQARDGGARPGRSSAQARTRRFRYLVAGVAAAVVAGGGLLYWAGRSGSPAHVGPALWARLESYGPPADFFARVPRSTLELYALAPAIEADLQYIPCYCGCGQAGHTSNRSCYLKSPPGARPAVWDPHAAGCQICMEITRDVIALREQGMRLTDVRTAIDRKYAMFAPPTPTPFPPEGL